MAALSLELSPVIAVVIGYPRGRASTRCRVAKFVSVGLIVLGAGLRVEYCLRL